MRQGHFQTYGPFWRDLLSFGIAALFTYAAVLKAADIDSFRRNIEGFELLPQDMVPGTSYLIPLLELGMAVALLLPGWRQSALWGAGGLTFLFLILMGYALARGLVVDCGCFGKGEASRSSMILGMARNGILLAVIIILQFWNRSNRKP